VGDAQRKLMRAIDKFLSADCASPSSISTIRQILYSFVRILNTRSAIGYSFQPTAAHSTHVYEVRTCKDKRGFDLISEALPFGRLWYGESNAISNAIGYA